MVRTRELLFAVWAIGMLILISSSGACGGNKERSTMGDDLSTPDGSASGSASFSDDGSAGSGSASTGSGTSGSDVFSGSGGDAAAPCSGGGGLQCYVPQNCTTTLTGTVYDPANVNPLYNAVVFIPNDPNGALAPVKVGTNTCNTCDVSIGDYVTATTTGADGKFTLTGVPATTHVPLVVQIGKWRREVFLSQVKACAANTIPQSANLTRLPRNQSEGSIPKMAIVTGGADALGCFLTHIGLDKSEYTAPKGGGRLDVYKGLGNGAPGLSTGAAGDCSSDNPACVWNSKTNLEAYDILLLACEGNTYDPDDGGGRGGGGGTNKTASSKQALHDWLDEGGKVFATHYHYTWFKNSPAADFQGVAGWNGSTGGQDTGLYNLDVSFPKGQVLSQWLGTVGALTGNQIQLSSVAESVATVNAPTQRWIYNPKADTQNNANGKVNDVKYLSFLTPVGGAPVVADGGETTKQYCGKAVFSDLHVGADPSGDIPDNCNLDASLKPQLDALEFLFFDLSACVSVDSLPPPSLPPPAK